MLLRKSIPSCRTKARNAKLICVVQQIRRSPEPPRQRLLVPAQAGQNAAYVSILIKPCCRTAADTTHQLVFDNWRVLHGRSAFTGKRRMCGGYSTTLGPVSLILHSKLTGLCSSQPRRLHLQIPYDKSHERADRGFYCDWLRSRAYRSNMPQKLGQRDQATAGHLWTTCIHSHSLSCINTHTCFHA